MEVLNQDLSVPLTWKRYLITACKFLFIFYITTFCMLAFFTHRGDHWLALGILMGIFYLFILILSGKQLMSKLPMAAILLAAPTIPFLMLVLVISMIPALQFIDKLIHSLHF